jgi:tetratricopeptide (TPR) repeat protein
MRTHIRIFSAIILIGLFSSALRAEDGVLVLNVINPSDDAISNVTLKCKGDAASGSSDRNGTARLRLPAGTRSGSSVVMQVLSSDWALISPWDGRIIVPPFDNNSQNFVSVVVAKKGDKQMLASAKAVEAMASRVIKDVGSRLDKQLSDEERQLVLQQQAKDFGLTPEEVDQAIREWSKKVKDPYQKGLAELYQRNYPKAVDLLSDALERRIKKLQDAQNEVADAADFLGQALFGKGQYRAAADTFKKALALKEGDGIILNSIAVSLRNAGDVNEAARYGERAVQSKADDPRMGPYHPATAIASVNLALVYQDLGKYEDSEQVFKRAVEITERGFGPDALEVANCLDLYAELLTRMKRTDDARDKKVRASAIRARRDQQARTRAIVDSKQLLTLKEQQLGPNHLDVAEAAGSLGSLYQEDRQYKEAEVLFKRALAIRESVAGKEDLGTAGELQRLALLYAEQNRYPEAEPISKRALAVLEKEFGQNNPVRTLPILENYANVLRKLGRLEEAQTLETRAQEIRAKDRSVNPLFLQNSPNQQAPNQEVPNQLQRPILNQQQLPIELSPNQN